MIILSFNLLWKSNDSDFYHLIFYKRSISVMIVPKDLFLGTITNLENDVIIRT